MGESTPILQVGRYHGLACRNWQDVLLLLADGFQAKHVDNKVGMERQGFTAEEIEEIRMIFKTIYKSNLIDLRLLIIKR